jgi:hypothetical protein
MVAITEEAGKQQLSVKVALAAALLPVLLIVGILVFALG